jgi:hypothetical protein
VGWIHLRLECASAHRFLDHMHLGWPVCLFDDYIVESRSAIETKYGIRVLLVNRLCRRDSTMMTWLPEHQVPLSSGLSIGIGGNLASG